MRKDVIKNRITKQQAGKTNDQVLNHGLSGALCLAVSLSKTQQRLQFLHREPRCRQLLSRRQGHRGHGGGT